MDSDINRELSSELLPITSSSALNTKSSVWLSNDQVVCMCETLLRSGNIERLTIFLGSLPQDQLLWGHETVLRARAAVAFHFEDFNELYSLLESSTFQKKHQSELRQLWYRAHYRQLEKVRGQPLSSGERSFLRNKYPLAGTIGKAAMYNFKGRYRNIMGKYYRGNRNPNSQERLALAQHTGLSVTQVTNWFRNTRRKEDAQQSQRDRTPQPPPTPCIMTPSSDASQCYQLTSPQQLSLSTQTYPSVVATSVAPDQLVHHCPAVQEYSIYDNTQIWSPSDLPLGPPPPYHANHDIVNTGELICTTQGIFYPPSM